MAILFFFFLMLGFYDFGGCDCFWRLSRRIYEVGFRLYVIGFRCFLIIGDRVFSFLFKLSGIEFGLFI